MNWLKDVRGLDFPDYQEPPLVDQRPRGFWGSLWDFFEIRAHTPYERVLGSREMPGAEWFRGARLNFAEHMLGATRTPTPSRSSPDRDPGGRSS